MPYATREQIAHVLKLTPRMVNRHVKENGMPIIARGEYDLVACVHWYLDYLKSEITRARRGDETEQQARARLVKATANLRELELAREEGRLIPLDIVRLLWERITVAFKNKVLSIPSKLPQKLIGCQDLAEMKGILESELYEALLELSSTPISTEFESAETSLGEPAEPYSGDNTPRRTTTKANGKRVGRKGAGSKSGVKRRARKVAHREG